MSNQIQFATVKFFAQLIKHTILIFIKAHTYGFKVARRVFIKHFVVFWLLARNQISFTGKSLNAAFKIEIFYFCGFRRFTRLNLLIAP